MYCNDTKRCNNVELEIEDSAGIYDIWIKAAYSKLDINYENQDLNITQLYIYGKLYVNLTLNGLLFQKQLTNITKLVCADFRLISFTNIYNNINVIHFTNLQIQHLEFYYFEKLYELTNLKIIYNNISVIQNYIFSDLNKLNKLNISHNNIAYIESKAFTGLHTLVLLDLNFNSILELHVNTLKITNILGFNLTKTIRYINLKNSALQIIKSRSFIFDNITSIDLSHNQITLIKKNAFDIKTISIINLEGNKLYTIDRHVFFSINVIGLLMLFDNNIECDCRLNWIKYHTKMLTNLNNAVNKNIQCGKYHLLEYIEYNNCSSTRGKLYIYIYIYIIYYIYYIYIHY